MAVRVERVISQDGPAAAAQAAGAQGGETKRRGGAGAIGATSVTMPQMMVLRGTAARVAPAAVGRTTP